MTDDFQPVQGASIFVGNLSFASTAEDIQAAFSKFGPILKVALPGSERRHVGYSFVHFTNSASANAAMTAMNNTEFGGRVIRIELCKNPVANPKPKSRRGRRGRGGAGAQGGDSSASATASTGSQQQQQQRAPQQQQQQQQPQPQPQPQQVQQQQRQPQQQAVPNQAPVAQAGNARPMRAGGVSNARVVDDESRKIAFAARAQIEAKAGAKFAQFEPLLVSTQVVAGSNFFFKIQTAPTGCIHARVYRDLSNQLSVHSVQTNKQIGDPLVHF